MAKQTREELLVEVSKLTEANNRFVEADLGMRKEFAKAFNWFDVEGSGFGYSGSKKLRNPSWSEIFVELGKVLACRDFRDIEGNVSEIEYRLENLVRDLKSEVHPNLNV